VLAPKQAHHPNPENKPQKKPKIDPRKLRTWQVTTIHGSNRELRGELEKIMVERSEAAIDNCAWRLPQNSQWTRTDKTVDDLAIPMERELLTRLTTLLWPF